MKRKLSTYADLQGVYYISYCNVDDLLWQAREDGVKELVCTKEQLKMIEKLMVIGGNPFYNIENKTFAGLKFVEDNEH